MSKLKSTFAAVALAVSCGAASACHIGYGQSDPVAEESIRRFYEIRNVGDIRGLVEATCGDQKVAFDKVMGMSPERRESLLAEIRAEPVHIDSVEFESRDGRFHTYLVDGVVISNKFPGRQRVTIVEGEDRWLVCVVADVQLS